MGLEKAIAHGKEHRKQYRKSARFDASCRPHGGCTHCLGNRTHKYTKQIVKSNHREEDNG